MNICGDRFLQILIKENKYIVWDFHKFYVCVYNHALHEAKTLLDSSSCTVLDKTKLNRQNLPCSSVLEQNTESLQSCPIHKIHS